MGSSSAVDSSINMYDFSDQKNFSNSDTCLDDDDHGPRRNKPGCLDCKQNTVTTAEECFPGLDEEIPLKVIQINIVTGCLLRGEHSFIT